MDVEDSPRHYNVPGTKTNNQFSGVSFQSSVVRKDAFKADE